MKTCNTCGLDKPVSAFYKNKLSKGGLHSRCRECTKIASRKSEFKRKYGITREDYDRMLEDQNGTCAICDQPETNVSYGSTNRLAVDHCHETGEVRALLCAACNIGLGNFRDNTVLLQKAICYLERP